MLLLDGTKIVYVDKIEQQYNPGALRCSSFVGMHADIHSTASGKMLLSQLDETAQNLILEQIPLTPTTPHTITNMDSFKAELAQTKNRGYGLEVQENSIGLQCVAVPILNLNGECIAAISVSSQVALVDQDTLESHILAKLLETGKRISAEMGHQGPYIATD